MAEKRKRAWAKSSPTQLKVWLSVIFALTQEY